MKYLKATLNLLLGMVEVIISFPFMLFVIPVRRWNATLYGRKDSKLTIRELDNGNLEITLPNGEVFYGRKEV